MIIVVTNKEDVHPTPVIEHLEACRHPVFRLNTEALMSDYDFTWSCGDGTSDFHITNLKTGTEAWGHDVRAVWERRPIRPAELRVAGREEINRHNLTEGSGFLSFLLYYLGDRFCLGHHLYDQSGESKMLQLKTAAGVGFDVPATCFSSRKADIMGLARRFGHVILKPVSNDNVWLGGEQQYVFYSCRASAGELEALPDEAFSQTVTFAQQYIDKQFELRVTVIDGETIACKIDSQTMDDDKGRIDWRQGYDYGLPHEPFTLPCSIAEGCREYLRRMHLNFGCFDFIVTPDGRYVFIECNPNGQWLWIERLTGQDISGEIARCLMRHDTCGSGKSK